MTRRRGSGRNKGSHAARIARRTLKTTLGYAIGRLEVDTPTYPKARAPIGPASGRSHPFGQSMGAFDTSSREIRNPNVYFNHLRG